MKAIRQILAAPLYIPLVILLAAVILSAGLVFLIEGGE